MSKTITAKKGLSLRLKGGAKETFLQSPQYDSLYAIVPEDFIGVVPKLAVRVGDTVSVGEALFYNKKFPQMKFVSPVAGEVVEVERGAKRKILSVQVKPAHIQPETKTPFNVEEASQEEIKNFLLEKGLWSFIWQRPYAIIAEPHNTPRDIFVTAHFTAPLAPDFNFLLEQGENRKYLVTALKALRKLTPGKVYIGVKQPLNLQMEGIEERITQGPHPAGCVGFLINAVKPINKGDVVWTMKATDLLVMGRILTTGIIDFSRTVAVTGSEAVATGYVTILPGCELNKAIAPTIPSNPKRHLRLINGDVFTGKLIDAIRPYASWDVDQTTLIPEGDETHEILGWIAPRLKQFSISRTYFSWLSPKKEYALDARLKGGERHMIMSGEFEKVFPLNIMPEALIKATIAYNIDKMEALGIYEVAPEDFALCEFVDSSKQPLQDIIRNGLDMLYKEMN